WLPVRLPKLLVQTLRCQVRLRGLSRSFARRFREEIVPAFLHEIEQESAQDLARLDDADLLQRLEHWIRRTLHDFARDTLKPTALAAVALGNLERALKRALGPEQGQAAVGQLVMGVRPEPDADLPGAVQDLAAGRLERTAFLARFGHRGSQEMELAR